MPAPAAKKAVRVTSDSEVTAPRYLSGIQDLLSGPTRDVYDREAATQVNRIPEADSPPLSALVEVYSERVERRKDWLHASLLPTYEPERPIRHVLGPRPIPIVLQSWLAAAERLVRHVVRRARWSVIVGWARDHRAALRLVALLAVVAATSSLMTLLATRW